MPRKETLIPIGLLMTVLVLTASISRVGSEPTYLGNLAQYLVAAILTVYFLAVIAYARVIMEAIASYLLRHRSQQGTSGGTWAALLGYIILVGSMMLLVQTGTLQKLLLLLQQSAALIASTPSGSLGGQTPSSLATAAINPALYLYTVMVFLAIVLLSFTLFFGGLHMAYRWARDELRTAKSTTLQHEALEIVRKAAESLKSTGEYREVILRCYRQMCQALSENGFNIGLDETAREFSRNVSGRLKLGSEAVRSLTFLFEEARYSDHQIGDEKRVAALNELNVLERALALEDS